MNTQCNALQSSSLLNRSNLNHHLARIRALVQIHQCLRCDLQTSRHDMLLTLQLPLRQPCSQVFDTLGVFLCVVEDDKTLHGDSLRLFPVSRWKQDTTIFVDENSQ